MMPVVGGNHGSRVRVKTGMRYLLVICGLLVAAAGCGQSAGASHFGSLIVTVTAGPTCPVERIGDPACAPRPMQGAQLRLDGSSEITLVTDASGTARADQIPVGDYRIVPQSVEGLMGTPAPLHIVMRQGEATHATVSYDTGIR
jgi:hypothetical protein